MIDMANGAHIDMRLGALKFRFRHPPPLSCKNLASHRDFIIRVVPLLDWLYTLHEPTLSCRAHDRTRTDDLFLTKEVLCLLSYVGPRRTVQERETGLEPATPSLEGWRSSQLSYSRPVSRFHKQWGGEDSNLRRLSQQIYSLPPLTAREPPLETMDR